MKKVLYVILTVLILYFVLCLVGPSDAKAERSISVNAPAEAVKAALVDNKIFHEKWSPWTEKDPGMKVSYEGTAGQPGQKMSWESDKKEVGKGSMTIEAITADSVIQKLNFDGRGDARIYFVAKGESNTTNVTWGMEMKTPFMMRAMMLFMNMDKMIGPDFEKGLGKLKTYVESTPAPKAEAAYDVKELNWEARNYFGTKKTTVTMDKIGAFFGESFQKIGEAMGKAKLEMQSAPSGLYFSFDEKNMSAEMAAVIGLKTNELKGFEKYEVPASKVLQVAYYGDYMKMQGAHEALKKYIAEKNLNYNFSIEEYVTDPMVEKDTAKWQTNIYYILK
ncbi:MAG: SRPBCC family protein [Bacteroidia bacterium]